MSEPWGGGLRRRFIVYDDNISAGISDSTGYVANIGSGISDFGVMMTT